MKVLGWNKVQELLNGLDVLIVLAQRILKLVLLFDGNLSPDGRGRVCKDPAGVML